MKGDVNISAFVFERGLGGRVEFGHDRHQDLGGRFQQRIRLGVDFGAEQAGNEVKALGALQVLDLGLAAVVVALDVGIIVDKFDIRNDDRWNWRRSDNGKTGNRGDANELGDAVLLALALDMRHQDIRIGRRRVTQSDPLRVEFLLLSQRGVETVRIEVERKIALAAFTGADLGLQIQLRRCRPLHEHVAQLLVLVVVVAPAVGFVIEGADAERQAVVNPRQYGLGAGGIVRAAEHRDSRLHAVALEQSAEFVQADVAGADAEIQVDRADARLHRVAVDILQHLRLQ